MTAESNKGMHRSARSEHHMNTSYPARPVMPDVRPLTKHPSFGEVTVRSQETIRAIIDRLIDAWNKNDMMAFVSLFSEDADYISGAGLWFRGRQAIQEGLSRDAESSSEHGNVVITGNWIRFIKADVAIVQNTWEMRRGKDQREERVEWRRGIFTQVMVSDGERWRIAALQNTDIDGRR